MTNCQYFKSKIFDLETPDEFEKLALELFQYQYQHNEIYRQYVDLIKRDVNTVKRLVDIPHLPIHFFKSQEVKTGEFEPEITFSSSGTSGQQQSFHHVKETKLYEQSFSNAFKRFYEKAENYCVLALLPSYLERKGSSLIYMADQLINLSADKDSGFYLNEYRQLSELLKCKSNEGIPCLLLGVTYALLDLAEQFPQPLQHLTIMETGGMKGRRKEMIRWEVHGILKEAFKQENIHSEYGMTELLSQAYSKADGRFICPPWMRVTIREVNDPFRQARVGKTGGINVVDLANVDSCAFIETQDLGRLHENDSFEVMGRFDNSDIRGCNLMVI